jgi:hypothetical protein
LDKLRQTISKLTTRPRKRARMEPLLPNIKAEQEEEIEEEPS